MGKIIALYDFISSVFLFGCIWSAWKILLVGNNVRPLNIMYMLVFLLIIILYSSRSLISKSIREGFNNIIGAKLRKLKRDFGQKYSELKNTSLKQYVIAYREVTRSVITGMLFVIYFVFFANIILSIFGDQEFSLASFFGFFEIITLALGCFYPLLIPIVLLNANEVKQSSYFFGEGTF